MLVCGCHSGGPFVCFGAKPTQRASARDLSRDRKDEGRKVQEKSESAEGSRREQLAWNSSPGEDTVGRRRLWKDGTRAEKRVNRSQKDDSLDLLTYRGQVKQHENMSALPVALWEFSLDYTLALAHRMHSVSEFSFLALGANPSLCLFVLFFYPLGCVLYVR